MKRLLVVVLVLLGVAAGYRALERVIEPAGSTPPASTSPASTLPTSSAEETAETHPGFLNGRITTVGGATYEGRLRFGGDEEAFWGDYFNGVKDENPWAAHVPPERLKKRHPIEVFGFEIGSRERRIDLGRPFMTRFGDIVRIEAGVRHLRVTLKSGTVFDLDRFDADDFADGVRVWGDERGVVDLDELRIRTIELFAAAPRVRPSSRMAERLYGTVHTRQGDFTGFVQWDREKCVGSDPLVGRAADSRTADTRAADGELRLRFDAIRSIARHSRNSSLVTLLDGREIVLSGTREAGDGNRGIYVDDRRYGRVLVSWDAFERIDFSPGPGGSGPAYGDFPPGRPLAGSVTTRAGRRLAGRLVYDLDESETTETLDAPFQGVTYTIPFGLVASIVPTDPKESDARLARVTLQDGQELQLERAGDLGEGNAGLLVFLEGGGRPEYVPWDDVERVDLARPPAMYPPLVGL